VHSPMSGAATAAGAIPAQAEGTGRRWRPRQGVAARPGGAGTAAARRWPRGSRAGTPHAWPRSRPQAAARTPRGQGSPSLQSRPASAGCSGVSLPGLVACAGHHCFSQQQGAALPPGLDECMPWESWVEPGAESSHKARCLRQAKKHQCTGPRCSLVAAFVIDWSMLAAPYKATHKTKATCIQNRTLHHC